MRNRYLPVVLVFALAIGLVLSEALLRLLYGSEKRFLWPPNAVFLLEPNASQGSSDKPLMPGISGISKFTVNSMGLRGAESGGSDYLIAIGGSTTECLYLDDQETWPALVQNQLSQETLVLNAGKSGLTSAHHLLQVVDLMKLEPGPQEILVMMGLNDLLKYLSNPEEPFWKKSEAELVAEIYTIRPASDEPQLVRRLQLFQLLRRTKASFSGSIEPIQDLSGNVYAKWRKHRQSSTVRLSELPDLKEVLDQFERNAAKMIELCRNNGVQIRFLNQAFQWSDSVSSETDSLFWMGGIGDYQSIPAQEYYSNEALAKGMHLFNRRLEEFCGRNGVQMIDLAACLNGQQDAFYDAAHFNEQGAQLVANCIEKSD